MRAMTWTILVLLASCAPHALPEARPDDFSLAATVHAPPAVASMGADAPRSLRPGRYIVEPSGTLRADWGPASASPEVYPPAVRQLSPRQVDQLWRLVRDAGFLDRERAGRLEGFEPPLPSPTRSAAGLSISASGRRTTLRVLLDDPTDDAREARLLIDRLAELAWLGP